MDTRTSTETWVILAAAAALVTGGGLFLSKPFEASRPKSFPIGTQVVSETATIPARLWQDPFSTVAHWKEATNQGGELSHLTSLYQELPVGVDQLVVMPVLVYGGFYSESIEKRRRRRYAVLSAAFAQSYRPTNAEIIGHLEVALEQSGKPDKKYSVPFEWLEPNDAYYDEEDSTLTNTASTDKPPHILLLWLDEHQFGATQLQELSELLQRIVKIVARDRALDLNVSVKLLGPSGSRRLHGMVSEVTELIRPAGNSETGSAIVPDAWEFSIYSPVATASAKLIIRQNEKAIRRALGHSGKCEEIELCRTRYGDNKYTSLFLIEQAFHRVGVSFFRTITSDRRLLQEITNHEFRHRRIRPTDPNEVVILVSEWDTFYGRSLPAAFVQYFRSGSKRASDSSDKKSKQHVETGDQTDEAGKQGNEVRNQSVEAGDTCPKGVCQYVYMRGLDGEILTTETSKHKLIVNERAQEVERAVGVNRFDYLRRLAHQISEDFSNTAQTVRAVGVLGSDLYDKLLILQALRSEFPDALFFTTDADARLFHPAEIKWTRGMVLSAGFDLSPNQYEIAAHFCLAKQYPNDHHELPPFRDNYQTSVFLATLLALHRDFGGQSCRNDIDLATVEDHLRRSLVTFGTPQLFEVGRSGLVSLTRQNDSILDESRVMTMGLAALGVILLYSIYAFLSPRYTWREAIFVLLVVFAPLGVTVLAYYLDGAGGEPLPVFGGANVLPTTYLVYLAVILVYSLLMYGHFELRRKADLIATRFNLGDQAMWARYLPRRTSDHLPDKQFWMRLYEATIGYFTQSYVWLATVHILFSVALILLLGDFNPPIRGHATYYLYIGGVVAALIGVFMLTYFIADEARRCQTVAYDLLVDGCWREDPSLEAFVQGRRANVVLDNTTGDALQRWRGVRLLAERTVDLEKIVYYPFAVLLLMILSHSGLVDYWRFAPSVAIVLFTGFLVNAACFLFLRVYMGRLRKSALSSLRQAQANRTEGFEALDAIFAEVKAEDRGSFRPLGRDAIFKAPLIPLGGYGGLYLIEYLGGIS